MDLSEVSTKDLLQELGRRIEELEASKPSEKYTLKEMAMALGVSKFTLQRWCREGMPTTDGKVELQFAKIGRDYVFTADEYARIKRIRG
tara:strand:- start:1214 stop:1480 length:267 start_codon:yes stop_codon:yes gene_type:complete